MSLVHVLPCIDVLQCVLSAGLADVQEIQHVAAVFL